MPAAGHLPSMETDAKSAFSSGSAAILAAFHGAPPGNMEMTSEAQPRRKHIKSAPQDAERSRQDAGAPHRSTAGGGGVVDALFARFPARAVIFIFANRRDRATLPSAVKWWS